MRAVRALDSLWQLGQPPKAEVEVLAQATDLLKDVSRRRQADAETRAVAEFMGSALAVSGPPPAARAAAAPRCRDLERARKEEEDFM